MKDMKKLIKVLMKRWWLVLLVWIAIIIQCFLQLQLPDRMNAIQSIITKIPQPDDAINQIWVQGGSNCRKSSRYRKRQRIANSRCHRLTRS